MDRTEAIKHLKVVLKTCDVQDEEAVEMAIAALEGKDIDVSTKWTPCSDCERRCKKWEHSKTLQE